jgi:hypothetical protein
MLGISVSDTTRARQAIRPVESKHEEVRYFHIHESEPLDEELVASWIGQAVAQPGEPRF